MRMRPVVAGLEVKAIQAVEGTGAGTRVRLEGSLQVEYVVDHVLDDLELREVLFPGHVRNQFPELQQQLLHLSLNHCVLSESLREATRGLRDLILRHALWFGSRSVGRGQICTGSGGHFHLRHFGGIGVR